MGDSPGKRLEAARKQRGWTVNDVARMTKMRAPQIRDLEMDSYENFANPAYAKSFLKMYAKFLHLDLGDAAERLYVPEKIGIESYQYLSAPREEPPPHRPRPRVRRLTLSQTLQSGGGSVAKWLMFGLICLPIVAFLAVFAVTLHRLDFGKATGPATEAAPIQELATPLADPSPAHSATPEADAMETAPPPRALPVHTPAAPIETPTAVTSTPTAVSPRPTPEPEVRRAAPVRPLPQ